MSKTDTLLNLAEFMIKAERNMLSKYTHNYHCGKSFNEETEVSMGIWNHMLVGRGE